MAQQHSEMAAGACACWPMGDALPRLLCHRPVAVPPATRRAGRRYDGLLKVAWARQAGLSGLAGPMPPMGAVGATLNVERLVALAAASSRWRRPVQGPAGLPKLSQVGTGHWAIVRREQLRRLPAPRPAAQPAAAGAASRKLSTHRATLPTPEPNSRSFCPAAPAPPYPRPCARRPTCWSARAVAAACCASACNWCAACGTPASRPRCCTPPRPPLPSSTSTPTREASPGLSSFR